MLQQINWDEYITNMEIQNSVNMSYNTFVNLFNKEHNVCFPLVSQKGNKNVKKVNTQIGIDNTKIGAIYYSLCNKIRGSVGPSDPFRCPRVPMASCTALKAVDTLLKEIMQSSQPFSVVQQF